MSVRRSIEYATANSVDEAISLLAEKGDTRVVAGGYSLVPLIKDGVERPDRLVDISGIDELQGVSDEDGAIRIGALTTHDRIAASTTVRSHAAALGGATGSIGDYIAKRQGTIGGNLVVANSKYDLPAAVLALDATLVVDGPGGRRYVDAEEWFRSSGGVSLGSDELVTEIVVPHTAASGYARTSTFESADSGYATVSVAAAIELDSRGVIERSRVAANGAVPYPTRLNGVEEILEGERLDDDLKERASNASLRGLSSEQPIETDAAPGEHRLRLVRKYCKQAIDRAGPERASLE